MFFSTWMACEARWPFSACSYGGICNQTLKRCVCTEDFVDVGDFWPTIGADCVVPIRLRNGFIFASIAVSVINFILRIRELYRAKKAKDCFQGSHKNPQSRIFYFHCSGLLMSITCVAMSLGSWFWRDQIIGLHLPKTILFTIAVHVTWFAIHYAANFCIDSIHLMLGNLCPTSQNPLLKFVTHYSMIFSYSGVIMSSIICPFGLYFSDSDSNLEFWALLFSSVAVYVTIINGVILLLSIEGFIATLREVISQSKSTVSKAQEKTEEIVQKLEELIQRSLKVKVVLRRLLLSTLMFNLAFCIWPWARSFISLEVVILNFSVSTSEGASRLLGRVVAQNSVMKRNTNRNGVQYRKAGVRSSQTNSTSATVHPEASAQYSSQATPALS